MVHGTAVLKSEYDGLGLSVLWVVPNEGTKVWYRYPTA